MAAQTKAQKIMDFSLFFALNNLIIEQKHYFCRK